MVRIKLIINNKTIVHDDIDEQYTNLIKEQVKSLIDFCKKDYEFFKNR